jgi:hypothetical protein
MWGWHILVIPIFLLGDFKVYPENLLVRPNLRAIHRNLYLYILLFVKSVVSLYGCSVHVYALSFFEKLTLTKIY